METLIIKTEGKKLDALKAVLAALDITFKEAESSKLDRRLKEARLEKERGQLKTIDANNVWESIP
jgi:hypothetical protein